MAGLLIQDGVVVQCPHGGFVQINRASEGRVMLVGEPALTAADGFVVAGCPASPPCQTVKWETCMSMRIRHGGLPVLIASGEGSCLDAAGVFRGPAVLSGVQGRVSGV